MTQCLPCVAYQHSANSAYKPTIDRKIRQPKLNEKLFRVSFQHLYNRECQREFTHHDLVRLVVAYL